MNRVWIFQSDRPFTENELDYIQNSLQQFLSQWNTHGKALTSSYKIAYNQFIVIAAHEESVKASGCAIDSLTRIIKDLETELKVSLLDRTKIAYKVDDSIQILPLVEFKKQLKEGVLSPDTILFNNSVNTLELFESQWEQAVSESWAKNLVKK